MSVNEQVRHFAQHPQAALQKYHLSVPQGIFRICPYCQQKYYFRSFGKYQVCPDCGYGLRVRAYQRLKMLTKKTLEWDKDLTTTDPLAFPNYLQKVQQAQAKTKLKDAVWTGQARIAHHEVALGIMDPTFIMGSLGTSNGERLTRLFEKATIQELPVILLCASGGARMQEGILSLMQMAKISQAVTQHRQAGLFYLSILMDPTTGGVTASFATQADVIWAEPHALIGFAGQRVIEQTMNKALPPDFQSAEKAYERGFIDAIVPRPQQSVALEQMLSIMAATRWTGDCHE